MSGSFPRSWSVGGPSKVRDPDDALCRLWDALEDNADDEVDWDQAEPVINPLLDALTEAGYVETWGHSPTGCIWDITDTGHERLKALGRDA
jgi:DNA-binding PadR family transcriptional regulator